MSAGTKARGKTRTPRNDQPAAGKNPSAPPRGQGSQFVYETLRKAILELTLEPGSPLDEQSLSEQFDLSRTPVREALVRLAADGLVTSLPNRNTIVSALNFVQMPVYFEALTLMYRVTTRAAAAHRRPEHMVSIQAHEQAFAEAVKRHDAAAMIEANRNFHVAIAQAGGNTYFTNFFARLLDEGRRILRLYYATFDDRLPLQYVQEHKAMVAAIETGDQDLCDRLASEHARQIVRQIQNHLSERANDPIQLDAG